MVTDIIASFEKQCTLRPHEEAVRSDSKVFTYAELDTCTNEISQSIKEIGLQVGSVVAVELSETAWDIVAVLGILRSHNAVLPIDPSNPDERNRYILRETDVKVCVRLKANKLQVLHFKNVANEIDKEYYTHVHSKIKSGQWGDVGAELAYILYTSGSTGKPKGVAMGRQALSKLIHWQNHSDGKDSTLPTTQFAPLVFDVAFQEILSTLCAGGVLVLVPRDIRLNPESFIRFISRERIGRLFLPTVALHPLANAGLRMDGLPHLRHVYVAGEQLRITPTIREWFAEMPECMLHNHYGPTETHVVTSFTMQGPSRVWPDIPPIGVPLPHVMAVIANEEGEALPPGEIGELVIGGECLAFGYINRPDLTSERFVESKFWGRVYRTGDLAIIRDDIIEYKGRSDSQVKISGHRVELAEVEVVLCGHPDVTDAVVVADDVNGRQRLVAYVSSKIDQHQKERVIEREFLPPWRDHVAKHLPSYMVPSVWIRLAGEIPVTKNGKLDRNALPAVLETHPRPRKAHSLPKNQVEDSLASIWRNVLELREIGVDESFFDLGGTSLLAVDVAEQARRELGFKITPLDLYGAPTIRQLAQALEDERGSDGSHSLQLSLGRNSKRNDKDRAIAVIGLACRFPGASNIKEFWDNLRDSVESITYLESPQPVRDGFVKSAGLIEDVEKFDVGFFGYSAHQAALIDPQHRLFLECVWEALEDGAVNPEYFGGRIGVFGGTGPSTYMLNNLHPANWRPDRTFLDSSSEVMMLMGNDKDFLTSRVSQLFDLRGPSLNINAACATSLFAIHYAQEALINKDCDLALAGAVCIPIPQLEGYLYEQSMPFSPDGHCRPFDERAEGTVFGSGAGVVLLKRLSDAIADRDDVYAVILGSAVGNDGAQASGMAAPSIDGQTQVIDTALRTSCVSAETIRYVEGHGTATEIGDSIEVSALSKAFGYKTKNWCGLGSVKSNVGHLGWAAGMAGFIKTVLSLRHARIPPTLHFVKPNPLLSLDRTPFFVVDKLIDFPESETPRRASVSAFGLGGYNAHVVLEEAPVATQVSPEESVQFIPISARSDKALKELAGRYVRWLRDNKEANIDDIAMTCTIGRRHHECRQAFISDSVEDLIRQLEIFHESTNSGFGDHGVVANSVCGVFGGSGTEYNGMGQDLYESEPVFKASINAFDEILLTQLDKTGAELLYGSKRRGTVFKDMIEAQVALFIVQISLFRLWESLGVHFQTVMGHSLGEYAAACVAGVFSVQDGLQIIINRTRAIREKSSPGAMAVISADETTVRSMLNKMNYQVDIAVVNSPTNTIISGLKHDVEEARETFAKLGYHTTALGIQRAGHSFLMAPVCDVLKEEFDRIVFGRPDRQLVSTVTGSLVGEEISSPNYWVRHVRDTVRFSDAVKSARALGMGPFVDLGGAGFLLGLAQETISDHLGPFVPSLRKNKDDNTTLLHAISQLYTSGIDFQWQRIARNEKKRVHLPTYPFEREHCWVAPSDTSSQLRISDKQNEQPCWYEWCYQSSWSKLGSQTIVPDVRHVGKWLILGGGRTGAALVKEINKRGGESIQAVPGTSYKRLSSNSIRLDLSDEDHLCLFLSEHGSNAHGVIQLYPLETKEPGIDCEVDLVKELSPILLSSTYLVRLLRTITPGTVPRLFLLTQGAQQVIPSDRLNTIQVPMWGLGSVIQVEAPELNCVNIDIPPGTLVDPASIVDFLLSNLHETRVAVRQDGLYTARLTRCNPPSTHLQLRDDATYLVTGGLSGLGLWTARQLALNGVRHLCLASRRSQTKEAHQLRDELLKRGVDIKFACLDVADPDSVEKLFRTIEDSGHPLIGIIHCAGVLDDALLDKIELYQYERVLLPKVQGGWNLHRKASTLGIHLDMFVVFSSATSILGNYGQANYAAANAYLDGLIHYRRSQGLAGCSINWGAWSEIGGAASIPGLLNELSSRGMGHIKPVEGADVLMCSLESQYSQVGILPNAWDIFLDSHGLKNCPFFEEVDRNLGSDKPRMSDPFRVQLANTASDRREDLMINHIVSHISRFVGKDLPVDADDSIPSLGLDSLSIIQLRNSLSNDLKCSIPPGLLINYSTPRQIANYLLNVLNFESSESRIFTPTENSISDERKKQGSHSTTLTPLSIQQRRWLSLACDVKYGGRVVPVIFHAPLSHSALHKALSTVVARHELLRFYYPSDFYDNVRRMDISDILPNKSNLCEDLRHLGDAERAKVLALSVKNLLENLPDPRRRPPWMIHCYHLSEQHFALLIGGQHLEFDGPGLSVFVDELDTIYHGLLTSSVIPELPEVTPYQEYVTTEEKYQKQELFADRAFFEGLFASVQRRTLLNQYVNTTSTVAYDSRRYTSKTPLAQWELLQNVATSLAVPPFAILLSTYARLVSHIVEEDTVVISIIRNSRVDERFARTIGPFTMPFPVPIFVKGRSPVELARQCGWIVDQLSVRGSYPSTDLIDCIEVFQDLPFDTYFSDVSINFLNYRKEKSVTNPRVEVMEILGRVKHRDFSSCDFGNLKRIPGFHLVASLESGRLVANYWYHTERFTIKQVEKWANLHKDIMEQLLEGT